MKTFEPTDIEMMDPVYRLHFINSITGFKSANLIGTKSSCGITNLAVFSSVTHMGSNPPVVGFFIRPGNDPSDTFKNILETKSYTINHIHDNQTSQAHQTSVNYSNNLSEFKVAGFTEHYTQSIFAPYVDECQIKMGLEYINHYPIPVNGTVLIVGKILEIKVPEKYIGADGYIDLIRSGSVTISGLDAYYKPTIIHRLDYAKTGNKSSKSS